MPKHHRQTYRETLSHVGTLRTIDFGLRMTLTKIPQARQVCQGGATFSSAMPEGCAQRLPNPCPGISHIIMPSEASTPIK